MEGKSYITKKLIEKIFNRTSYKALGYEIDFIDDNTAGIYDGDKLIIKKSLFKMGLYLKEIA